MSSPTEIYDHAGNAAEHGRARVNGIRMHYIKAGKGAETLLLLHGTPKTSFYWYRLIPLLTEHFTVVAPDLRGFGYSDKPPATDGYDSATSAKDVADLMTSLAIERFHVHGEDRGAEYAYAVAALYRDRVKTLSFCEMAISGFGLEESSFFTSENVTAQYRQEGVWCWHLGFFYLPHVPEMLIQGHEREFWEMFMRQECYDPTTIEPRALDHWVECVKQPGGLRGILETYRAGLKNAELHRAWLEKDGKLTLPTMAIGALEFFGPLVEESIARVVERVQRSEIFEKCGHSLSLEAPEKLALCLKDFMLKSSA